MAALSTRSLGKLPLVVILGATGAGKSKLALEMAQRFNGEIISADSMQVYQGLDIVTNKVTPMELKVCRHHLIGCMSPLTMNYTVVQFRNAALPIIENILERDKLPIVVGGTNYYIESLLWHMLVDQAAQGTGSVAPPSETNSKPIGDVVPSSESSGGVTDLARDSPELDSREGYQDLDNQQLHDKLKAVDAERAKQLHPNDRRKVIRSLEVFSQHGRPMSDILSEQHEEAGDGAISGPLRYPNPCVIWVQCHQQVLDERTDKRVDQMMALGLLQELKDFHRAYNRQRLAENKEPDYTQGIFQSIGFKEFHPYLILSEEDQDSDRGRALLSLGLEDMKVATRQYSRKQVKWMTARFLRRRGRNVPPVYDVSSTDATRWQHDAHDKAADIISAFIQGVSPTQAPLAVEENVHRTAYNTCDICDRVFTTTQQWEAHIKGRRHRKMLQRKHKLSRRETEHDSRRADEDEHVTTKERTEAATINSISVRTSSPGTSSSDSDS